jgi:hypothetical protein
MARYRVDCGYCVGGFREGECTCGEDCCCCLYPDPPTCDVCLGTGYLIVSETDDPLAEPVEE